MAKGKSTRGLYVRSELDFQRCPLVRVSVVNLHTDGRWAGHSDWRTDEKLIAGLSSDILTRVSQTSFCFEHYMGAGDEKEWRVSVGKLSADIHGDVTELEAAAKTLRTIANRMEKMAMVEGSAGGLGTFVNRLARAIGADTVITCPMARTGLALDECPTWDPGQAVWAVDKLVADVERSKNDPASLASIAS